MEELSGGFSLTEEERKLRRLALFEKNKNRFSRKNISRFVEEMLADRTVIKASEIMVTSRREMIRLIFVYLYGKGGKTGYLIQNCGDLVEKEGFRFRDFEIKRRQRTS